MKTGPRVFLTLFLVAWVNAQDGPPPVKVGDPAPPLRLDRLLQAPETASVSPEALKGNVVVVELWATWCGPCREAQTHLNKLAVQYRDKSVRFISVTDEEEWKVKAYLSVNPIVGWIGIDRENSFSREFGFKTIPQTVLIDRRGRVAAILQPRELTGFVLDQVLAVGAASLPAPVVAAVAPSLPAAPSEPGQVFPSLLELVIRPAHPSASMSRGRGVLQVKGKPLKDLISLVFSTSPARVIAIGPIPEQAYGLTARVPEKQIDQLLPTVRQAMAAAFGLRTWKENREMEVLVLRVPSGRRPSLRDSRGEDRSWMTDDGQISGSSLTMTDLCLSIENELSRIVLDETGLKGTYDVALYWDPADEKSIFLEVGRQLGLELGRERRRIEVLCFEIPMTWVIPPFPESVKSPGDRTGCLPCEICLPLAKASVACRAAYRTPSSAPIVPFHCGAGP